MKKLFSSVVLFLSVVLAIPALADVPASLKGPHKHGTDVSGNIILFRVQTTGIEIGPKGDQLDAEVLVVLDSEPDKVFGLRYHEANPATGAIVDTLRAAYINKLPVTIQHVTERGRKNLKINWVQLSR